MGLAVLRAFGRTDAAPLFAAALADEDFAMRWQVMRELLALDTAAALPHLTAMAAQDPHPEVRAAATATLALLRARAAACPVPEPA
jgi:HEAT repeat protein